MPARSRGLAKSARELVNTSSQADRRPGTARGRVTVLKTCQRPAFRSSAASSSVASRPWSTPARVRKAIGNMPMVWTNTRPPRPYIEKFCRPRSCLVMRPLLPARRIIDRVRENGGDMTGSWAIAERNFLLRALVR